MYYGTAYPGDSLMMSGMQQQSFPAGMQTSAYSAGMYADSPLVVAKPVPSPCDPCNVEYVPVARIHIVRRGETVYSIANSHGLDWRELAGYNRLGNPNLIYPGEHLEIPPSHY
ncbi:LysM domain-containing protein [Desulfosporosinus acidiphilus SJ4]|uniref:LysM domain-containing protein n=1 Tax=Desulfosporosinus acidiphilus (strain DSM 22704 / JCM 16185 / SJ4) TaxID=646529 RepID=I4D3X9_DESAJ|nr:LysM domain-containing protein [Desulfosporosinus acidiphilus]AFM40503.1 LysM domain-containing protein [Desulfosporosinus acidiphilus SJ4]